jgi:hypothetical protein
MRRLRNGLSFHRWRGKGEGGEALLDSHEAIVEAPGDLQIDADECFQWTTLGQIKTLLAEPGKFTNEARSIISLMLSYL